MSSQVLAAVLEQEGQRWLEPHLNHQVRFQLQQLPGALSTAKLQESAPTHPAQTSRAAAASATAHLAAREKKKKVCNEVVSWQINDLNPLTLCWNVSDLT